MSSDNKVIGELFISENGRYKVDGTVFVGNIQRRKRKTKKGETHMNVVNPIGYKLSDLKNGNSLYAEKFEAIDLIRKHGSINATIRPRKQVIKDEKGIVISSKINLNLHPSKLDRPFTDIDRLFPIFKLDRNGKMIKPAELYLKGDDCSKVLWNKIIDEYERRKKSGNSVYQRVSDTEKIKQINQAMQVEGYEDRKYPF